MHIAHASGFLSLGHRRAGAGGLGVVPGCGGVEICHHTKDQLWARYSTAAPRPRTRSERQYSDRKLRSKSFPSSTIQVIAWHLERCLAGEITRLIITLPPRSLKSICASVATLRQLCNRTRRQARPRLARRHGEPLVSRGFPSFEL